MVHKTIVARTLLAFTLATISLRVFATDVTQPVAPLSLDLSPVQTLVLIELAGGNDGLDTVIPYADPAYAAARPTLAIPAAKVLKLNDALGLHPNLAPLLDAWKAGDFAIVLGVGYPDPNRSHFRGTDIWETGSASNVYLDVGWIARLWGASARPADIVADSIILGETRAGPLKGPAMHNLSLDNLDAFLRDAAQLQPLAPAAATTVGYINSVQNDIVRAASILTVLKPLIKQPTVAFPDTPLASQMKTSYQLLSAGVRVPVIKLTLRGFDTHGNERVDHDKLLAELGGAVAAFRANLIDAGLWNNVLVMTYSEFGRRVAENGSGGTDHGTAAPLFILGGRVIGGLYGSQPSLTDLDQGDLKFTTDFRVLYRTVAHEYWGIDNGAILDAVFPGVSATLPLIREK